jgi:hypothetical protein
MEYVKTSCYKLFTKVKNLNKGFDQEIFPSYSIFTDEGKVHGTIFLNLTVHQPEEQPKHTASLF